MKLHKIASKIATKDFIAARIDPIDNISVKITCVDRTQKLSYYCTIKNTLNSTIVVEPNLFYAVIEDAQLISQKETYLEAQLEHAVIKIPYITWDIDDVDIPSSLDGINLSKEDALDFFKKLENARDFLPLEVTSSIGGILIDNLDKKIVATNGSVLCQQTLLKPIFNDSKQQIVIDRDAFCGFETLDYLETNFRIDDKTISLFASYAEPHDQETYNSFIYTTLLPTYQTYPMYAKLFPIGIMSTITLSVNDLKTATQLVKLVKGNLLIIDFLNAKVTDQDSSVIYDIDFKTDDIVDFSVTFNNDYITRLLNVFEDNDITVTCTTPDKAFVFSDENTKILCMPLLNRS